MNVEGGTGASGEDAEQARWDLFVSYAWRDGRPAATAIARALERFNRPMFRTRAQRVFVDVEGMLQGSGTTWEEVEAVLRQSGALVVILTPGAAESPWVNDEIRWWLHHRPGDRLFLVHYRGELRAQHRTWDRSSSALPPALVWAQADDGSWFEREARPWIPLDHWPSGRRSTDAETLTDAAATIVGSLSVEGKDRLKGDHLDRRRRRRLLVAGATAVILVLAVTATIVAISGDRSDRLALSRQLAAASTRVGQVDAGTAALLAVQAFHVDRNPDSLAALFRSVQSNAPLLYSFAPPEAVTALAGSSDGTTLVLGGERGEVASYPVSGEPRTVIGRLAAPVSSVASSSDGRIVAAADGRSVMVSRPEGTESVAVSTPSPSYPTAVGVAPGGGRMAVFLSAVPPAQRGPDSPGFVAVFDLGRRTYSVGAVVGDVNRVAVPDAGPVIAASSDGRWQRFAPDGSAVSARSSVFLGKGPQASAVSANGAYFVESNGDTVVPVYNTAVTGDEFREPDLEAQAPGAEREAMAVTDDGRRAAVADSGTVYVVDTAPPGRAPGQPRLTVEGNRAIQEKTLTFIGSDRLAAVSAGRVVVWSASRSSRVAQTSPAPVPFTCNSCFSPVLTPGPRDDAVAAVGASGELTVTSASASRAIGRPKGSITVAYTQVTWNPDGSSLVAAVNERPEGDVFALSPSVPLTGRARSTTEPADQGLSPRSADGRGLAWIDDSGVHVQYDGDDVGFDGTEVDAVGYSGDNLVARRHGSDLEVWSADGADRRPGLVGENLAQRVRPAADRLGTFAAETRADGTTVLVDLASTAIVGVIPPPQGVIPEETSLAFTPDARHLVQLFPRPRIGEGVLVRLDVDPSSWVRSACTLAGRDLTPEEWERFTNREAPDDLRCSG